MWHKLAVLVCLASGAFASDAVTNATAGPWTAELNGIWRWHVGDDLRWASPSFDDSAWPTLTVPGRPPSAPRYWIRIPVRLGPVSDPGLLLGPITYAYQVFWDGQRIGSFGDLSRGKWFAPRWQTFHLPRDGIMPGAHMIAVRAGQIGAPFGTRDRTIETGDNRIGELVALHDAELAQMWADFQPRLLQLLVDFGLLLAGLYFLLLPPSVSQGAAFRWLGVILLGRALLTMNEFYASNGPLDMPGAISLALEGVFGSLYFISVLEFSYALFRRPIPLAIRCFECLLATSGMVIMFHPVAGRLWFILLLVPSTVPVFIALTEIRRLTPGARLNLVLFCFWGAATLDNILLISFGVPIPTAIYVFGYRLWVWDAVLLLWVPAIAMQIHKANLRFRDDRQRLRLEMEAAQHVQQLLLPSQSIDVPGFQIDASYQPATEVGGDFFQLFPAPNDALLVVVGDVSGKGMKAALVVSVIVGALQNRKSDQPAAVLRELNQVLLHRSEGGFTTCCCALFASDGSLAIANAGHLAPYRNGIEMETPPALPLGVDVDARWTEAHVDLQPSDRVLWISDGVVEARNDKRDLLGFERAEELARQSAVEIARAAQRFGQEDDITVLSVTRQSVAVHSA